MLDPTRQGFRSLNVFNRDSPRNKLQTHEWADRRDNHDVCAAAQAPITGTLVVAAV